MILVTGGTGLVGGHLLLHLLQNDSKTQIRATYRSAEKIQLTKDLFEKSGKAVLFKNIDWVQADLLDITDLGKCFEGITHVYHSAAMISFKPKDYSLMRKTNIEGTANMVNFSVEGGIKKFCFVSSIAAVEENPYGEMTGEDEEWNAERSKNGYAISKYGAEMEVWRGSQEGLDVVIVNPGVILGPGYWNQGSGKLFRSVAKGLKYYTTGITGFVGVWDVVRGMQLLMDSSIKNERYIFVSENLSYQVVLESMAKALGVKAPSKEAGKFLMGLAWRMDWLRSKFTGRGPRMTKFTAASAISKSYYSSKKIESSELDFEFEPIASVVSRTVDLT